MSGRLRVLGVLVLVAMSVLAGRPAAAGGPTSVLLSVPGEGRVAALYTSGADYDELATYVGAFGTPGGTSEPGAEPHESGPSVTLTWLIHDVSVWRVDRVYVGAGEPWIATQTSLDGSADLWSRPEVWHTATDGKGLVALLTKLGVNPANPAPASSAASDASGAVAAASAPVPASPVAPATEPDGQGWTWALVGLVAGAVLTVTGEQLWTRRRRPAGATQRPSAPLAPSEAASSR